MAYENPFELVSREFEKAKIPYILIGGFAVNFYKVSRSTLDVDFLMALEDFQSAVRVMEKNGYQKFDEGDFFVRLRPAGIAGMIVDFVLVDRTTLDKILQEARPVKLGGLDFKVPSLNHLIALKLHALKNNPRRGPKDLLDIFDLIKNNEMNITTEEFRQLCLKFGTEEVYSKILEVFK
ncbi:MAG: nucleotidyltransferase [Chlamydiae bacterium]|nr:nucleotidyltransferase [Chlamydiota bacterium]MBI3276572.1 nucleotidyltransferase [Chlamydiota bacterium]